MTRINSDDSSNYEENKINSESQNPSSINPKEQNEEDKYLPSEVIDKVKSLIICQLGLGNPFLA